MEFRKNENCSASSPRNYFREGNRVNGAIGLEPENSSGRYTGVCVLLVCTVECVNVRMQLFETTAHIKSSAYSSAAVLSLVSLEPFFSHHTDRSSLAR